MDNVTLDCQCDCQVYGTEAPMLGRTKVHDCFF